MSPKTVLKLKFPTDPLWVKNVVESNIEEILTDHAFCEQKAVIVKRHLTKLKIPIDIRQLYTPTQPASNLPADGVTYVEFLPDQRLQPFIYFYWALRTIEPLKESMTCKIVADGCIDIFFELNNPQDNFVIGFCKKYTEFPIGNSFHYVGVRFLPTMFAQIYNIDSSELSNRIEHLNIVVPQIATFITDSFSVKQGINEIKSIFNNYFNRVLTKTKIDFDHRLYES